MAHACIDCLRRFEVLGGQVIFADDTPLKMLAPGTGKTATVRLWAYGRDERPWGSDAPPASWYRFSPDRKGQHLKDSLTGNQGWMHAEGYAGFEDLYRSGDICEVACTAHVRRKFVDDLGGIFWTRSATRRWWNCAGSFALIGQKDHQP